MDILNNAWVVGIGGGILSGLIVTLITRYIFSKRDNKEYAQKIDAVNREVVYALRPGISQGHIPTEEVLTSLVNATARKYRINREDAFRPKQIAEELIKEIMDSSFISSETKKAYCETLAHLVNIPRPAVDHEVITIERKVTESDYRNRMASRMSAILGLTAAMVTMLSSFTRIIGRPVESSSLSQVFEVILPTMAILVSTMLAMVAMLSSKRLQARRDKESPGKNTHSDGNDG